MGAEPMEQWMDGWSRFFKGHHTGAQNE